jgi:hypothetical protein
MRKSVILTTVFFFTMLGTQAILGIHLLCEEHRGEHDSKQCPLCQQLLSLTRSITTEEQITISQAPPLEQGLICDIKVKPAIFTLRISSPRAPPVVL